MSCSSLNFHLPILSFISGCCLQQLLLQCSNDDLLFPSFLLHLLIGIILKELSHLFIIYSFIQSLIPVGTRDIHFRNHRMVKHCSKFLYPASKDYFYYYYCYIGPCYGTTKCMYTSMQLSLYCQEECIDSEQSCNKKQWCKSMI